MRASPSLLPGKATESPSGAGRKRHDFSRFSAPSWKRGREKGCPRGGRACPGRVAGFPGGGNHVAGRGIRGQRTEGQGGEGMIGDGMDQNDGLQSTRIGAFPQGGEDGVGHIFAPTGRQEAGERSFLIVEKLVDGFLQEGEAFCVSGDLEMLDGVSLVCQGGGVPCAGGRRRGKRRRGGVPWGAFGGGGFHSRCGGLPGWVPSSGGDGIGGRGVR